MLIKVTNDAALSILGALEKVARGGGNRSLTPGDYRALDAFDRFVLRRNLGTDLTALSEPSPGQLDPEKFWFAWERGGEVTTDVFADDWEFWAAAAKPIDDLRAAYHVPPMDSAHAADGKMPTWYKPVP